MFLPTWNCKQCMFIWIMSVTDNMWRSTISERQHATFHDHWHTTCDVPPLLTYNIRCYKIIDRQHVTLYDHWQTAGDVQRSQWTPSYCWFMTWVLTARRLPTQLQWSRDQRGVGARTVETVTSVQRWRVVYALPFSVVVSSTDSPVSLLLALVFSYRSLVTFLSI